MAKRGQKSSSRDESCRTCKTCRQKKIKCDGLRPKCAPCQKKSFECVYLQDARRSGPRFRKENVGVLQQQIQQLKEQLQEQSQIPPSRRATSCDEGNPTRPPPEYQHSTPPIDYPLPGIRSLIAENAPSTVEQRQTFQSPILTSADAAEVLVSLDAGNGPEPDTQILSPKLTPEVECHEIDSFRVYGATSLLHDRSSTAFFASPATGGCQDPIFSKDTIRDRLIANAAIRRQEEAALYSSPSLLSKIDFDGVPADTALHLLDLHWNRQHLSYLLTYRPAIMDSLINNGPHVNKLLLNSIYFQSSLYSDRIALLRKDPKDPQSMGETFYDRFKSLLMDHIDKPTVPTVVALLTCGACLVPRGRQSAGWVLGGMAYRMMTDLGCHLDLQSTKGGAEGQTRRSPQLDPIDIEIRQRVYWAAYVGDKLQSLFLGRPPALDERLGRGSEEYLDVYEEMEEWKPYVDSDALSFDLSIPAYRARPCYAISTFRCLLQLCRIISRIIETFYVTDMADTAKTSSETQKEGMIEKRKEIREHLRQYREKVPSWLQYDPGVDAPPPPHQFTPHVLYWASVILTEQSILDQDSVPGTTKSSMAASHAQAESKQRCIEAALNIWKLVEAYKKTFTLRRAQYGISYATYCAVLVILRHTDQECDDYVECIRFFWQALLEFQRGCNYGLKRPLKLLKSLMSRMERVAKSINMDSTATAPSCPELTTCQADIDSLMRTNAISVADDMWMTDLFNGGTDGDFLPDRILFGIADDNLLGVYI